MESNTQSPLLQALWTLLQAHRPIFRQARTFWRVIGLFFGEVFGFARHTVTQNLLALGLVDVDWSAWYRLFSHNRFRPDEAGKCMVQETAKETPLDGPYVMGVDGVQVPRASQKMPGTCWLKALGTAPFKPGIHRAQRFLNASWLAPRQEGYSRAIPLQWFPAFPEKAVPSSAATCKEWEAGAQAIRWVREQLDAAGRSNQMLLALADGSFEKAVEFWKALPERTIFLGRTARNRVLYALPKYCGKGRPPEYGDRARTPAEWLKERAGWLSVNLKVRGRVRDLRYRVEGPFVRQDLPKQPVYLLVVRGCDRVVDGRRVKRDPGFYLVSAKQAGDTWELPLPAEELLAWAWQRWELEVEHREVKSGFGLGEKQCWNKRSAVVSVQWSAWVYGVLLLAGYRTWGLLNGPACPGRWWRGAARWSFTTLLRGYRAALWTAPDFRAVWTATGDNWLKKGDWLAALGNAAAGAART